MGYWKWQAVPANLPRHGDLRACMCHICYTCGPEMAHGTPGAFSAESSGRWRGCPAGEFPACPGGPFLHAAGTIGELLGQLGSLFFMLFVMVVLVFTFVGDPRVVRHLQEPPLPAEKIKP